MKSYLMTTLASVLACAALLALGGCADLKALDDAAMAKALEMRGATGELQPSPWPGVITVPPQLQCSFDARYQQAGNCCVMPRYTSALDVDTAYARAMQAFGFPDKRVPGIAEGNPHYHGHVYLPTPGALYRLADDVVPRDDIRLNRGVWVGLTIAKASANTAEVEPVYCQAQGRLMSDQLTWHQAVQDAIHRALPPAAPTVAKR